MGRNTAVGVLYAVGGSGIVGLVVLVGVVGLVGVLDV